MLQPSSTFPRWPCTCSLLQVIYPTQSTGGAEPGRVRLAGIHKSRAHVLSPHAHHKVSMSPGSKPLQAGSRWQAGGGRASLPTGSSQGSFSSGDLHLLKKLLRWPAAQLFPSLDLARLVALQPDGQASLAADAGPIEISPSGENVVPAPVSMSALVYLPSAVISCSWGVHACPQRLVHCACLRLMMMMATGADRGLVLHAQVPAATLSCRLSPCLDCCVLIHMVCVLFRAVSDHSLCRLLGGGSGSSSRGAPERSQPADLPAPAGQRLCRQLWAGGSG